MAHYGGHDPESGCGLMILGAAVAILAVFVVAVTKILGWW